MAKYKRGDVVYVRQDLEPWSTNYHMEHDRNISDVATGEMVRLAGYPVTIRRVVSPGKYAIVEMGYNWTDEMFEDSEPEITPINVDEFL